MYQLTDSANITRLSDNASIPADPANSDYAAYLKWVAEGNVAAPVAPEPVLIPQTVTRFQALAALDDAGYLGAVESIMASPATPKRAKLAWASAQSFERSSPTLALLAEALKLEDAALDALFVTAAGITA